jgi:hypothetical protein
MFFFEKKNQKTFMSLALVLLSAGRAFGWGHTGHVYIGEAAIMRLPPYVPVLHGDDIVFEIGEMAAEPDISKGSGDVHDAERDPGHFIDLDEKGFCRPNPAYPEIPALNLQNLLAPAQTRRDFDTLLRQNGATIATATQYTGYLPFNLADQWQQIRKDFAYIRAFTAAIANPKTVPTDKTYFAGELKIRAKLLVRDVGYWAHFVGDASQPMHVSVHFNGWGAYPNPQNFTQAPIHSTFEGAFVRNTISRADILQAMAPPKSCEADTGAAPCAGIEGRVRAYLQQTLTTVTPLYQLTKTLGNGDPWTTKTPTQAQKAFVVERLAAAAAEMRDEIVDAWQSSKTIGVGYPLTKVADIESGTIVWTAKNFAGD